MQVGTREWLLHEARVTGYVIRNGGLHEVAEPMDVQSDGHGQSAYLTLNGLTLSEGVKLAFVPRIARQGDNVSPAMSLRHAGEVLATLAGERDTVSFVSVRTMTGIKVMTVQELADAGRERVTGRETTLVHERVTP